MPEKLSKWIEENLLHFYEKKSLDGYKELLHSLNLKNPKEIILIGGTNGKGSLSELVSELAIQSNLSVGVFTSPHLLKFNERIKVNGKEISDEIFLKVLKKFNKFRESHNLNFYQIISLAALYHFNNLDLDLWVLEIGMGGRLDPMNFIEPDISVITKVALDHEEYLGNSIEEIAAEKAEIARPKKPLIFGSKKIPIAILNKINQVESILISHRNHKSKYLLNFINKFSNKNSISEEVLFCLYQISKKSIFKFSNQLIENVIQNIELYGRLTLINNCLVDSAHNEDSIKNLLKFIRLNFDGKKIKLFFCCSEAKDPYKLLKPFEGIVDNIYLGDNIHGRLMPPKDVLSKTNKLNFNFIVKNSMEEIYSSMCSSETKVLNVFTGSFYFSGEVFKFLLKINNLPISLTSLNKIN